VARRQVQDLESRTAAGRASKAVTKDELQELNGRLTQHAPWPLGLEGLRSQLATRVEGIKVKHRGWEERVAEALERPPFYTAEGGWAQSEAELGDELEELVKLIEEGEDMPVRSAKLLKRLQAMEVAAKWAHGAQNALTTVEGVMDVTPAKVKKLVPRDGQISLEQQLQKEHLSEVESVKQRVAPLKTYLLMTAKQYKDWAAGVSRAIKRVSERRVTSAQLQELRDTYPKLGVRDEETMEKLTELISAVTVWEANAHSCLKSKDQGPNLDALLEKADDGLRHVKLQRLDDVRALQKEAAWLQAAEALVKTKAPITLDKLKALLNGDPWNHARWLEDEMQSRVSYLQKLAEDASRKRNTANNALNSSHDPTKLAKALADLRQFRVAIPEEAALSLRVQAGELTQSPAIPLQELQSFHDRLQGLVQTKEDALGQPDPNVAALGERWKRAQDLGPRAKALLAAFETPAPSGAVFEERAKEAKALRQAADAAGVEVEELSKVVQLQAEAAAWERDAERGLAGPWDDLPAAQASLRALGEAPKAKLAHPEIKQRLDDLVEALGVVQRAKTLAALPTDDLPPDQVKQVLTDAARIRKRGRDLGWVSLMQDAEAQLQKAHWYMEMDRMHQTKEWNLEEAQALLASPMCDRSHSEYARLKDLVKRAEELNTAVESLLNFVVAGSTSEESVTAGLLAAIHRYQGNEHFTLPGSAPSTPSHSRGTSPVVSPGHSVPHYSLNPLSGKDAGGGLMTTFEQLAALKALKRSLAALGVVLPVSQTVQAWGAELVWYRDANALLAERRPRLQALVEVQKAPASWPARKLDGKGVRSVMECLKSLTQEGLAWQRHALALLAADGSKKGNADGPAKVRLVSTSDLEELEGLLKEKTLDRMVIEEEEKVRQVVSGAKEYVADAGEVILGDKTGPGPGPGAAGQKPVDVRRDLAAPSGMTRQSVLEAQREAFKVSKAFIPPVRLEEQPALEWLSRLLSWFYKVLETLRADKVAVFREQVDEGEYSWKQMRDEVLGQTEGMEVLTPEVPEPVQKALARFGVRIEHVRLEEAHPEGWDLEDLGVSDADPKFLLSRPVFTYRVHGSRNAYLLEALRLHARARDVVERCRQWQRTVKRVTEAGLAGQAQISGAQMRGLFAMAGKMGLVVTQEKAERIQRCVKGYKDQPMAARSLKRPLLEDDTGVKRKVAKEGDKKDKGKDKTKDRDKKLAMDFPAIASSPRGSQSLTGKTAYQCVTEGCWAAVKADSRYCSDVCMAKSSEPLLASLLSVKMVLAESWLERDLGLQRSAPPLLQNLRKFYADSEKLLTPVQTKPNAGLKTALDLLALRLQQPGALSGPTALSGSAMSLESGGGGPGVDDALGARPSDSISVGSGTSGAHDAKPLGGSLVRLGSKVEGGAAASREKDRERVRTHLHDVFVNGMVRIKYPPDAFKCKLLAWELEQELFRNFGMDAGGDSKRDTYRQKYVSLKYNLNDAKNPRLMERVVKGDLAMESLVHLSAMELASEEFKEYKTKREQEAMKNIYMQEDDDTYFSKAKDGTTIVHKVRRKNEPDKDKLMPPVVAAKILTPSLLPSKAANGDSAKRGAAATVRPALAPPTVPKTTVPRQLQILPGTPTAATSPKPAVSPKVVDRLPSPPPLASPPRVPLMTSREMSRQKASVSPPKGFKRVSPAAEGLGRSSGFYSLEQSGARPFSFSAYAPEAIVGEVQMLLCEKVHIKGRTKIRDLCTYLNQCRAKRYQVFHVVCTEGDPPPGGAHDDGGSSSDFESFCQALSTNSRAALGHAKLDGVQIYFVPHELLSALPGIRMEPAEAARFLHVVIVHKRPTNVAPAVASTSSLDSVSIPSPPRFTDGDSLSLGSPTYDSLDSTPSGLLSPGSQREPPPAPPVAGVRKRASEEVTSGLEQSAQKRGRDTVVPPPAPPQTLPPPAPPAPPVVRPPVPPQRPNLPTPPSVYAPVASQAPPPRPPPLTAPAPGPGGLAYIEPHLTVEERNTIHQTVRFILKKADSALQTIEILRQKGNQKLRFLFPGERGYLYFDECMKLQHCPEDAPVPSASATAAAGGSRGPAPIPAPAPPPAPSQRSRWGGEGGLAHQPPPVAMGAPLFGAPVGHAAASNALLPPELSAWLGGQPAAGQDQRRQPPPPPSGQGHGAPPGQGASRHHHQQPPGPGYGMPPYQAGGPGAGRDMGQAQGQRGGQPQGGYAGAGGPQYGQPPAFGQPQQQQQPHQGYDQKQFRGPYHR
jgi:cob(I)alamin adenosyltransferase